MPDDLYYAPYGCAVSKLPAGEYTCRILAGELATSKGGTPGYKLTLEVVDGDHAGRRAWHELWLTEAAMPMAKRDLGKIGVTQLDQLERPLPQGILVRVRLALRTADGGKRFNHVDRLEAAGVEAADPFAPKGDDDQAAATPKGPFVGRAGAAQRNGTVAAADGPYRDRR